MALTLKRNPERKIQEGGRNEKQEGYVERAPLGESDPDETEHTSTASGSESDSEADNITDNPKPKRARTEYVIF